GTSPGALCGVPVAVKDNISIRGLATTCGSRMLESYVPPYDATAVTRLRDAGAVIIGKTNMDEFAMGSSNENSAFGPTRNPWDVSRVPGGSSGGSAAAVAAGEVPLALGTDTGGSVRQPAGFCGVVGVKPTYGRVSRYGLVAFASSLDQIGTMSRDVAGAAALLEAIAGEDPRDSTTAAEPVPRFLADAGADLKGVAVGVPDEYFADGLDPSVAEKVRDAVGIIRSLGAKVQTISIPHLRFGIAAYYLVADAEASANLARYDGVRYGHRSDHVKTLDDLYRMSRSEGFGAEVKRRIMLGTYALSAGYYDQYYLKAQKARTLLVRDFERAFESVDAVVAPTSPTTAFALGERVHDPVSMYLSDIYTVPVNLAGLPALSVPCGFAASGLPVGLQIMVDKFREPVMFRVARAYERAAGAFPAPSAL
ncbi:MAG: Asp-tRNA(Asn)/Glu-tRNA(Gln) amidotransferase subunit GatA, partial [Candidatus Eisenbacteria sp.]|nr:Asp-tRNA(Asn)/Glu-tRNA(Gln) amidotransferase subunit GatA [Candidatus Eisenbacteria bacterium]